MTMTGTGSTKRVMAFGGALACLAGGCMTVMEGGRLGILVDAANRPQTTATPPALVVSAIEASSYSTRYLGLVEVTFENRTAVWKQVDHVAVNFGGAGQGVAIASAADIDAWERAITIRDRQETFPAAQTGIEALGLDAGDALGAWASHPATAAPAPAPAAVAAPAPVGPAAPPVAAPAPGDAGSATPAPPAYPKQHLLTTPFRIPPGLSTKRWILIDTPDNRADACIDSMVVSYETSDHATGRVFLRFKILGSDWQPTACPAPIYAPPAESDRM